LEKLQAEYGVQVNWHSYELRPAGAPPLSEEYRARILAARPRMVAMAQEQYGLEIDNGPFGIDGRPALIGAKYAEAMGVGPEYHDAIFRAYWQEARDISQPEVLRQVATAVNLDPDAFMAALDNPAYDAQVSADIEQAFQFGMSGVPAMVFNQKYLVVGAQPYELLTQVTEKVQAEMAQ
jgi:predicted DsbA family dithiol-disulfide isomerase